MQQELSGPDGAGDNVQDNESRGQRFFGMVFGILNGFNTADKKHFGLWYFVHPFQFAITFNTIFICNRQRKFGS